MKEPMYHYKRGIKEREKESAFTTLLQNKGLNIEHGTYLNYNEKVYNLNVTRHVQCIACGINLLV